MKKNWMDNHFGTQTPSRQSTPPQPRRWGKWAMVALCLLSLLTGAGIAGADYFGLYHFGIFEKISAKTITQEPPVDKNDLRLSTAKGPTSVFVYDLPPAKQDEPATTAAIDPAQQRRMAEHTASLKRGINLMQRDMAEIDKKESGPRWEITARPRAGRVRPLAAVEIVEEIDIYLRENPGLSQYQRNPILDQRTSANATITNSYRRLKELNENRKSLQGRIDKAQKELGVIVP